MKNNKDIVLAINKLPGKVLGYEEETGIYELSVACSATTSIDEVEATTCKLSKNKHSLERNGEENYLRFSIVTMQLKHLMGEVLTTLEATIPDERQLKASKSIVKSFFNKKISWIYEICGLPEEQQNSLLDCSEE